MAHGFQWVPRPVPRDDQPRCYLCHALLNGRAQAFDIGAVMRGASPHFCKEPTWGTTLWLTMVKEKREASHE